MTGKGGFPFLGILTLIFVVAKIIGGNVVETWSWWLVFSPMLLALFLIVFLLIFAVVVEVCKRR